MSEPEIYMNDLLVSDVKVVTLSQAEIKLVRKRKQSRSSRKTEKRLSPWISFLHLFFPVDLGVSGTPCCACQCTFNVKTCHPRLNFLRLPSSVSKN